MSFRIEQTRRMCTKNPKIDFRGRTRIYDFKHEMHNVCVAHVSDFTFYKWIRRYFLIPGSHHHVTLCAHANTEPFTLQ